MLLKRQRRKAVIRECILGHAVADAMGVPVEFCTREELRETPLTEMRGNGTYNVPAGSWSDDTSMTVAALDAIAEELNYDRVMQNFCEWRYHNAYTPDHDTFDCGITINTALYRYQYEKTDAMQCGLTEENSIGNGSLMRILPFALYALYHEKTAAARLQIVSCGSALTHAHPRAILACQIYAVVLYEVIASPKRNALKKGLAKAWELLQNEPELIYFERIFQTDFEKTAESEIQSGGYAVHALEAALWCLLNTKSYRDCVLKAINLGSDTDTTAAIAGGIAGVLYGIDSIPQEWLEGLRRKEFLEQICEKAEKGWCIP